MSNSNSDAVNRTDVQPWQDEQTLAWVLFSKDLTLREAGRLLGCGHSTVQYWRDKLDVGPQIQTRATTQPWQDPETLHWVNEKFGSDAAAGACLGCSRSEIGKRLNQYDIREEPWKDKDLLNRLYNEEGLSQSQIAGRLGVADGTVGQWLKWHSIGDHNCPTCGDKFPSERGLKIHHSNKHDETIAGVVVACDGCGGLFRRHPSNVNESGGNYCGRECHPGAPPGRKNPNWKGGYEPYYGENWLEQRRKALERDGHTCQSCGHAPSDDDRDLDVHHIRPLRTFDDLEDANALDNLVSLCRSCHSTWEGVPVRPELAN